MQQRAVSDDNGPISGEWLFPSRARTGFMLTNAMVSSTVECRMIDG